MNCPRCNYPINKDNAWSNCPKCNCRLDLETAPSMHVNNTQPKNHDTNFTQNTKSTSNSGSDQKQRKIAYCMNCGQKIEEGQMYCFRCGKAIHNPESDINTSTLKKSRKSINKKILIPICSGLLILVAIVTTVLILSKTPKKVSSTQAPISNAEIVAPTETTTNNERVAPTETTIDVNFDLNEYDDHGNLSCGLIWLKKDNWYENLDKSITEFAYFDINGNQVSEWFKWEEYYKNDFVNNYLVLHQAPKYKYTNSDRTRLHYIYDTSFNKVAVIEAKARNDGQNVNPVTDFNESGYAFAYGFDATNGDTAPLANKGYGYYATGFNLLFITKDGAHTLKDFNYLENGIYLYNDIIATEKYFIVGNRMNYHCVYNHEGNLLLDPVSVLNENDDFSKNYTATSGGVYDFQIDNNDICSFSFYAVNNQSNVKVKFSCKMDLNGNILSGPEKLQNQD